MCEGESTDIHQSPFLFSFIIYIIMFFISSCRNHGHGSAMQNYKTEVEWWTLISKPLWTVSLAENCPEIQIESHEV